MLLQVAVFVDAGYLFAQGSALLNGKKLRREFINLSERHVLENLTDAAHTYAPDARLLRIYWYDGVLRTNRPSLVQDLIGQSSNTKLRLGLVNSSGQQKGVDSLIVTDLIELARNQAISDALILSGDEDIKIGVQVAQTFGVRVHLLGIKPAKGSQSQSLMVEADTCHEWDETTVSQWMQFEDIPVDDTGFAQSTAVARTPTGRQDGELPTPDNFPNIVASEMDDLINSLSASDIDRHAEFLNANPGRIHPDIDRRTLASLRNRLKRDLTDEERKEYRKKLTTALLQAHG